MSHPLSTESLVARTRRVELLSGLFTAGTVAVLEMGPALAKKGFAASEFEVALLTSGQSLGLILSFFAAHYSQRHRRVPIVFGLQLTANLALCPVFFLRPTFALAFVLLHMLARICWSMSFPAQISIYRSNFPTGMRGRLVAGIRRMQLLLATVFAFILSMLLDWNLGEESLVRFLGTCPVPAEHMVRYAVPAIAVLGLIGSTIYRAIREARLPDLDASTKPSAVSTVREFVRVLREDRAFRRYEIYFFLLGFANIMSIPVTQIHAVDVLDASYFDLAMINVILVYGAMGLTMGWWGRRIDRHNPWTLRAVFNLFMAADFVVLFLAPTIEWVYLGRIFRGISLGGGVLLWLLGSLYFARSSRNAPVYTGIHTVLTGIRWGVAPFVAVTMKSWFESGSRPIFLICALILVLTAAGMMREAGRTPPGERA